MAGLRHSPGIYAAHPSGLDPLLRAPNSRRDRHNRVVAGGLDGIETGLRRLQSGLSTVKVVYEVPK